MRWCLSAVLTLFVFAVIGSKSHAIDVSAGINIGDDGVKDWYVAVGEHYTIPQTEVVSVRKRSIPDEELPVVFFIAQRAGVRPDMIIELRLGGLTWLAIAQRYGFTAEIFYIDVGDAGGPPYGKAYGHFRNRDKKAWRELRLNDVEVVNLVNLRFVSEYHGYSVGEVIKMREQGDSFVVVHGKVHKSAKATREHKASAKADANKADKKNDKKSGKPKK